MATRIRRLRRQRFLTQEELAKKARIHPISLVRIRDRRFALRA
jgi:DNA-binding XRE family transcriptional regulator